MKRTEYTNQKEIDQMDKINCERKDTTQKRVAHALKLVKLFTTPEFAASKETWDMKHIQHEIAHAVNLLEIANEEMRWHCEWFDYDDGICFLIDEACLDLGTALAEALESDFDDITIVTDVADACIKLSKALATLVRWDDSA